MIPEAAGEYFWKAGAAYCPGFFFLCLMSKNVFFGSAGSEPGAQGCFWGGLGEAKFAGNLTEDGNLQRRKQCDDTKEKGSE